MFENWFQVVGGRNGYGAKLANVFSTEFNVETCDGKNRCWLSEMLWT